MNILDKLYELFVGPVEKVEVALSEKQKRAMPNWRDYVHSNAGYVQNNDVIVFPTHQNYKLFMDDLATGYASRQFANNVAKNNFK